MRVHSRLLVASLVLLALPSTAEAARRIALVIGNDAYQNLAPLKKAVADAEGYAGVLTAKGFDQVILRKNVTRSAMDEAVAAFVDQIQPGDTVVFAYSGHGWSDGTQNFLIGIDAPLTGSQEFLARISIPLRNGSTGVIDDMERRGATLKVAIVDACRDNPFTPPAGTRNVGLSRGLVKIDPPEGTFVIFAAGAGQTSLDRLSDADNDPNSVFTRIFLPLIGADMTLQEATKQAQEKVTALARTISHKQQPAYYDEVLGNVCIAGDCRGEAGPGAVASQPDEAAAAYQAALAANSTEAWDAFLKYHPEGFYSDLARSARSKLEPAKVAALPDVPVPVPAKPRELKTINFMSSNSASCSVYPQFAMDAFGYLEKEGYKVTLLDSDTSVPYVAFLANDDADLAMLDPAEVLYARSAGQDIKVVYEAYQFAPEEIVVVADSPITELSQLKGKYIGLAEQRDERTVQIALDSVGLTLDDVDTFVVGNQGPTMAAALNDGTIDAFVGGSSDRAVIEAEGVRLRDITPDAVSRGPGNSLLAVWGPYLEEKRPLIQAFVRAWAAAQAAGPIDIKAVAAACATYIPEEFDNLDLGMRKITQSRRTSGDLQPDVWRAIQPSYIKAGVIDREVDPSEFLDTSFQAGIRTLSTEYVKEGIEAWKDANPTKIIN